MMHFVTASSAKLWLRKLCRRIFKFEAEHAANSELLTRFPTKKSEILWFKFPVMNFAELAKYGLTGFALFFAHLETALSDCQQSDCSIYIEPIPLKRSPPIYPTGQAIGVNGGMVEVEFMVGKNGQPFKPVVTYSTSPAFEASSIDSVRKYRYKPALLGGSPVDARASMRIRYEMHDQQDTVSDIFSRWYKRAATEFKSDEPNRKKIKKLISKMGSSYGLSAYAHARLNLIQLKYATLFGSTEEKITAARLALLFEEYIEDKKNKAISPEQVVNFRKSMFSWLVQTQRYDQALSIFYGLKSENELNQVELRKFRSVVKKINAILDNSEAIIRTDFIISERGFALENKLKNTISLLHRDGKSDDDGGLSSMALRCDRKYKELNFVADAEYQIPEAWGSCMIQILGKPGTRATLYQY